MTGTIVESRAEVAVPWVFAVAAVFCGVIAVLVGLSDHPRPGVWILGVGAVLLGSLGWAWAGLRGRSFAADARRLEAEVRSALAEAISQ